MSKREQLIERLQSKEYREAFVETQLPARISFQLRALRRERNLTQAQFAELLGRTQEFVSQLEDPNHGSYRTSSLLRAAAAFDVGLLVEFAPFSELVDRFINRAPSDVVIPNFESDSKLWSFEVKTSEDSSPLTTSGESTPELTKQFDVIGTEEPGYRVGSAAVSRAGLTTTDVGFWRRDNAVA